MARSLASIQKSIHTMSEATVEKDLFAMIYSEFGMGKTTLTMRLAQEIRGDGDILFCDSSDGWVALENTPELMDGTDVFRITDPADLVPIGNALKAGKLKSRRGNFFSVVVIDESSSVFSMMLEAYLRDKNNLGPDEQIPEAEGKEYGPPTAAFESMLRKFHDATGVHLLVTGHAREVGEAKELRPDFSPKAYNAALRKAHLSPALSARRKNVGGEVQYTRTLQLHPSAAVSAKCRIPGAPVKASEDEFIDLVVGWLNGSMAEDLAGAEEESGLADEVEHAPEPADEADDTPAVDPDEEEGEEEDGTDEEEAGEQTEAERRADLAASGLGAVRLLAKDEYGIDHKGKKLADLVDEILAIEYPAEEAEEAEEEGEDEEVGSSVPTIEELMAMPMSDLRNGADALGVEHIANKKKFVAAIHAAMTEDEE